MLTNLQKSDQLSKSTLSISRSGRRPKHGHACRGKKRSHEYFCWDRMKARCHNSKETNFKYYGARGVKVCDRWLGERGFQNFLSDLGPATSPKHTLDRINVSGDYGPENVRWAGPVEQNNNRTNNQRIGYCGQTLTISEWVRLFDLNYSTVYNRFRKGWPPKKLFSVPVSRFLKSAA